MKRCPQCHRTESDDALAFCRSDGTPLVRLSGSAGEDAGTLKLGSAASVAGETEARTLSPEEAATGGAVGRPTAPTTVLDGLRASGNTQGLAKPKTRRRGVVAAAVALAAAAYFYAARTASTGAKNSIAVMPFENASNDPNMEYLSDGISESLINSLS